MENPAIILKGKIAFLLKEFKKLLNCTVIKLKII